LLSAPARATNKKQFQTELHDGGIFTEGVEEKRMGTLTCRGLNYGPKLPIRSCDLFSNAHNFGPN
jgi:hypothetical protein